MARNKTSAVARSPKHWNAPRAHPLKTWRFQHQIRLRVLAERSGVSVTHLSQIETGDRNPSWDTATRISDATIKIAGSPLTGVSPLELMHNKTGSAKNVTN